MRKVETNQFKRSEVITEKQGLTVSEIHSRSRKSVDRHGQIVIFFINTNDAQFLDDFNKPLGCVQFTYVIFTNMSGHFISDLGSVKS